MPVPFALFGAVVCSEHPDKIALASDADIALPVIQAVYLRASLLFMGGLMLVAFLLCGVTSN
ncbi:MAG: hypothetical protein B0W54_07460 [Cellvibrio sp. 79]|nr:MAG: hypothetical protein B0W54_07460 [Cellvibrio sp. 79]